MIEYVGKQIIIRLIDIVGDRLLRVAEESLKKKEVLDDLEFTVRQIINGEKDEVLPDKHERLEVDYFAKDTGRSLNGGRYIQRDILVARSIAARGYHLGSDNESAAFSFFAAAKAARNLGLTKLYSELKSFEAENLEKQHNLHEASRSYLRAATNYANLGLPYEGIILFLQGEHCRWRVTKLLDKQWIYESSLKAFELEKIKENDQYNLQSRLDSLERFVVDDPDKVAQLGHNALKDSHYVLALQFYKLAENGYWARNQEEKQEEINKKIALCKRAF